MVVLWSVKLGGSVVTLYIVLLLLVLLLLLLLLLLLIHEHWCWLESLWLLHLRSSLISAPEGTWGVVHLLLLLLLHHKRVRHEDTWSELASLVLLLLAALWSRSGLDVDWLRVRRKGLRDWVIHLYWLFEVSQVHKALAHGPSVLLWLIYKSYDLRLLLNRWDHLSWLRLYVEVRKQRRRCCLLVSLGLLFVEHLLLSLESVNLLTRLQEEGLLLLLLHL